MLSSLTPRSYSFDKDGNITEIERLTTQTIISPQKFVVTHDELTCITQVSPQIHEISQGNLFNKMNNTYGINITDAAMNGKVFVNQLPSINNVSALPCAVDEYNKLREVQAAEIPQPLNMSQGNQYFINSPNGVDPGVVAVSNALFTANSAFQTIPICNSPKIFRRRRRGEPNSEWSNAFVTRIDPCECTEPEEEHKPYEMTKYYDESGVKTVFNFDNENLHESVQMQ